MFNLDTYISIFTDNLLLLSVALVINIWITYLRCSRLKDFIKIKDIKGLFLFLSFYRVANFTLPFKTADIIQFYFFKKILVKNKIFNILSLLSLTKLMDMLLIQIIAFLIFIIFILKIFSGFIFSLLLISVLFFLYKKRILIVNYIKKKKEKLRNIVNINKLFNILLKEIDYLFKKDLLKKSIVISILNYGFITIVLFIATDQILDREIFFLVFIFSILQPIPLKLFFGVGFFDLAVYISNFYFGIGVDVDQLLLFRFLVFSLLIIELFFITIYSYVNLIHVFSKKYHKR